MHLLQHIRQPIIGQRIQMYEHIYPDKTDSPPQQKPLLDHAAYLEILGIKNRNKSLEVSDSLRELRVSSTLEPKKQSSFQVKVKNSRISQESIATESQTHAQSLSHNEILTLMEKIKKLEGQVQTLQQNEIRFKQEQESKNKEAEQITAVLNKILADQQCPLPVYTNTVERAMWLQKHLHPKLRSPQRPKTSVANRSPVIQKKLQFKSLKRKLKLVK